MSAYVEAGATFGPGGPGSIYRYSLLRRWRAGADYVAFILLNPSTATATEDDPTIRRCRRFASDAGFGAMTIVNLFALRSTDPRRLYRARDPIGASNDAAILDVCRHASLVVAAWGEHGRRLGRGEAVRKLVADIKPLHVLRMTKGGQPGHPLYLPATLRPRLWERAA